MNTRKFVEKRGEFDFFDLKAKFEFSSASSISFCLGRWGNVLELDDGTKFDDCNVFTVCGWIDVHHPCEGTAAARIRLRVPKECCDHGKVMSALSAIFAVLEIPSDTTFVASVILSDDGFKIAHETNVFYC